MPPDGALEFESLIGDKVVLDSNKEAEELMVNA